MRVEVRGVEVRGVEQRRVGGIGDHVEAGPGGVLGAVHELEDLAHGLGVDRPGCDGHGDAPAVKVSVRGVYHRVVRTKDVIPGVAASELY